MLRSIRVVGNRNLSVHLLQPAMRNRLSMSPAMTLRELRPAKTKRPIRRIPDRSGVTIMRMISRRIRKVLGFLAACVVAVPVLAGESYCPARVQLKPMDFKIG